MAFNKCSNCNNSMPSNETYSCNNCGAEMCSGCMSETNGQCPHCSSKMC